MTRKDYILIAEALRVTLHRAKLALNDPMVSPLATGAYMNGILTSANELADSLASDNSRFDKEHFLAVVRGEKELMSRPSRNGGR